MIIHHTVFLINKKHSLNRTKKERHDYGQAKQWSRVFKDFKIGFKIKLGAKLN